MKKQTDCWAAWILFALLVSIGCNSQRGLPKAEEGSDAAVGSGAAGAGGDANGGTGVPSGGNAGVAGKGVDQPDAGDQISPPCTLGEMQCTNNGIEECRASGWVAVMACSGFCLNAKCVDCKPDAKQCKTDQPEVCDAKGAWTAAGARCDSGCNPTTGLCNGCPEAEKTTCTGKQVYKCSADKKWVQDRTCTAVQGCVNGACTACDPGVSVAKCEDTTVSECGTDGLWKQKSTCAKGCVVGTISCRVCTPNTEKRCSPSSAVVEKCNDAGNGWVAETTCPAPTNGAGVCANATCGSPTCNGGFTMCKDGMCRKECAGITGLGFLAGGSAHSAARATDFEGRNVVGDAHDAKGTNRAFVWTPAGGLKELALPNSLQPPSEAHKTSRSGGVILGSGGTPRAVVGWMPAAFTIKPNASYAGYYGVAVSADESKFLIAADSDTTMIWQAGAGVTRTLAGYPIGMSEDASIVITTDTNECSSSNGTPLPKATNGKCFSVRAVSTDGRYVFGMGTDFAKLARWRVGSAALEEISLPAAVGVINVMGTNHDGSVVIGYAVTSDADEVYWVWTESKGLVYIQNYMAAAGVSALGWSLLTPEAVSGNGKVIVGWGNNGNGDVEAFRLNVP
jgi:hypothetical protein